MTTALLVVDVQQGLCEGAHDAFDSQAVIARINTVSAKARAAGAPVIFVQHESSGDYLPFGSRRWQLAAGLEVAPTDWRIRKTTPDAFLRTDLQSLLTAHGVDQLIVCGMHTEFCIDSTTRQALALGYPVILVSDAHTTEGHEHLSAAQIIRHHNHTLANIESFGPRVRVIATADLPELPDVAGQLRFGLFGVRS